ncbi:MULTISPECIES: 1-deoxy-D-xylulose-5-phosphate reductoisomerase [Rossellomorea]|uniref:1-deoxy-D-xylulose 5-phosphate reductoisomerase n=1 Tax=Rossellomorea aquimaris TaxID=189382 RepID=A0A5D4TZZ9_9BACI|nr:MULTISPECIES: 1-deoxy-D-xylulose-5-phosphate reductoisomerase [Rossellomorea]MDT9023956.1 1-deoxy-D-xylulose-5-phosphate reductoisomerase [Rossellomorea sp. YC4-1]TYS80625.1 1-deoxy-D-xylulose-5-phosphate reductoisomerase [Rossellomorea aquimaris]TYS86008.1 1-deoxy-D-xylulose-5-phosphate reductoisomerase [Rossellomorea aquimaris]
MKKISLMGATGSIGTQTLDVIREHPEEFKLTAMSVGRNIEEARKMILEFSPQLISVQRKEDAESLMKEMSSSVKVLYGEEGLVEVACHQDADVLVNAVLGSVGLYPTLQAIEAGKMIAIANKETLVTAGHLVMEAARKKNTPLLPVDSEHSAIFQALQGEQEKNIEKLIITASGGSFRDRTREELVGVTVTEALNHPNWSMGAKITIDSASMMNKGLEVIEAHWLFDIPYDQIEVVQHRESIIHSMIQFHDSSVMAQLGTPDMRVPIQYALTYPDRLIRPGKRLNLVEIGKLHFEEMDLNRFRCLAFAYEAGRIGGSMTTVLNAANEAAVSMFLENKISFLDIEAYIEKAMSTHQVIHRPDLETIHEIDQQTRQLVSSWL